MLLNKLSMFKSFVKKNRGFTLLELLVVIAIIGIISAVGVPAYQGYVEDARDKEAQNSLQSISMMEKNYNTENFCYYTTSASSDQSVNINTNLFASSSGPLPTTGSFYNFWIANTSGKTCATSFDAIAQLKSDPTKTFIINEKMVKTKTRPGDASTIVSGW
jgi:prepilin-type N-terminal cleavage/methylation domain-containing protein